MEIITSDNNNNNNNNIKLSSPLKRNVSISKDGKMVYTETKPLGKVGGSEFIAVEKADPRNIPSYYFMVDNNGKKSPSPNENVSVNNDGGSSLSGDENQIVRESNDYEEAIPRKST